MLVRLIAILIVCFVLLAVILFVSKSMQKDEAKNKQDFLDEIEEVSKRVKDLK